MNRVIASAHHRSTGTRPPSTPKPIPRGASHALAAMLASLSLLISTNSAPVQAQAAVGLESPTDTSPSSETTILHSAVFRPEADAEAAEKIDAETAVDTVFGDAEIFVTADDVDPEKHGVPFPDQVGEKIEVAKCPSPAYQYITGGFRDHFALPEDPANVTQGLLDDVQAGYPGPHQWAGFDGQDADRYFGHEFTLADFDNLTGQGYRYGSLVLHVRKFGIAQWRNDELSLWTEDMHGGWGTKLRNFLRGSAKERELVFDLSSLRLPSGKTILDDVNARKKLRMLIQDDVQVDDAVLILGCEAGSPPPVTRVGVIAGDEGCGRFTTHAIYMDNEDRRNGNARSGWLGLTISDANTEFLLCAVNGEEFIAAATAGASFAVVAFSTTCPPGFQRFDRYHDNEDTRPTSWDTAPYGSPTATVGKKKNTNMTFCVTQGPNRGVPNAAFPDLGMPYGVFGGSSELSTSWSLAQGWVLIDDEDNDNANRPNYVPPLAADFLQTPPSDTLYYLSRVK